MRRLAVFAHRYTGLAMAGFLVIAGLTGSLLAFHPEIDAWLNPHLFRVEGTGPQLSLEKIGAHIHRSEPQADIITFTPPHHAHGTMMVAVTPIAGTSLDYNELFVDPVSGTILGRRMSGAIRFDRAHIVPLIYRLHFTLLLPGNWGPWLLGGIALAWMFDCFIGFYLTLPRNRPIIAKWKASWRIKSGAGLYRFRLDLHRAAGLWFWIILFMMALSAMSLSLTNEVLRPFVSSLLPVSPRIWDQKPSSMPAGPGMDWNIAVSTAQREAKRRGWGSSVSMVHLNRSLGFYMVRFGRFDDGGFGPSAVYVSNVDGKISSVDEAGSGKSGDLVERLMFPLHSGQVGGMWGRAMICVTGLVVALLSITGLMIWWKKRNTRQSPSRRASSVEYARATR